MSNKGKPGPEVMAQKVRRLRRIVLYREIAGVVIFFVGLGLLYVGLRETNGLLILINGILFSGYGCFMFWQAKRVRRNLGP